MIKGLMGKKTFYKDNGEPDNVRTEWFHNQILLTGFVYDVKNDYYSLGDFGLVKIGGHSLREIMEMNLHTDSTFNNSVGGFQISMFDEQSDEEDLRVAELLKNKNVMVTHLSFPECFGTALCDETVIAVHPIYALVPDFPKPDTVALKKTYKNKY